MFGTTAGQFVTCDPAGAAGVGSVDFYFTRSGGAGPPAFNVEWTAGPTTGSWNVADAAIVGGSGGFEFRSVQINQPGDIKIRWIHVSGGGHHTLDDVAITEIPADTPPTLTITNPLLTIGASDSLTTVVGTVTDAETATGSLVVNVTGSTPDVTITLDSVDGSTGEVSVTVTSTASAPRSFITATVELGDGNTTESDTFDVFVDIPLALQASDGWPFFYEANGILPSEEAGQSWSETGSPTFFTTGPQVLGMDFPLSGGGDLRQADGASSWTTLIDASTSWTLEFSLRVISDNGGIGNNGFNVWAGRGPGSAPGYMTIKEDGMQWGFAGIGPLLSIDNSVNTDTFHYFRIVFDDITASYYVYRDGVLADSLLPNALSGGFPQNWLILGDTGSNGASTTELDFVRWTVGAYAQPVSSSNTDPTINLNSSISVDVDAATNISDIGSVSDSEDSDGSLTVQVTGGLVPGVTMILANNGGTIEADVTVVAGLSPQIINVTIEVTDSGGLTAQDTIEVQVDGVDPLSVRSPWSILE